jgi:hypothetical protein
MSEREIHDDIVAALAHDAVSYSSVTRYLHEARFSPSKSEPHPADVQRDLDDSDQVILAALEDGPFASVRQLSLPIHLPSTTTYHRVTVSPNRWDSWYIPFDGCHMVCQMRKRARESICPGDYCECSKSSAIGHGMTSSPSTSLDFA